MDRYSSLIGKRVEAEYRAAESPPHAFGTLVTVEGQSIFLKTAFFAGRTRVRRCGTEIPLWICHSRRRIAARFRSSTRSGSALEKAPLIHLGSRFRAGLLPNFLDRFSSRPAVYCISSIGGTHETYDRIYRAGLDGEADGKKSPKAGFPVVVWNRTEARADELVQEGARLGAIRASVAAQADVLITIVSDPPAVEQILWGADGALGALKRGSTMIDSSTISPD